jgi:hypothetical protein
VLRRDVQEFRDLSHSEGGRSLFYLLDYGHCDSNGCTESSIGSVVMIVILNVCFLPLFNKNE